MWALRTRAFWALFLVIFAISYNLMTLMVHQNQYLVDVGFQPEFAAWMLGLSGILRSLGSVFWGAISDRTTREMSFTVSSLLGLLAMPCLLIAHTAPAAWQVVLFVVLIGLGYGGTSVLYAAAAADLFQGPHFGKILGILDIGFGLGAAAGSYCTGFLFDRFHTYEVSFYLVMVLILAAIGGMWIAAPRVRHAARSSVMASVVDP
jgi:MFS family permease